ncbi:MAG: 4-hydroxy-tetrahydrodipicolinate reductase [Actinobacteria bacterium]|nr:4-hydroxy-tetrahydrodipicolinate reductase [Actinomycetota bacterium]
MTRAIRVIVSGAAGRMGQAVVSAVGEDAGMTIAALADPRLDTAPATFPTLLDALGAVAADVVVDFTQPGTVHANTLACLEHGVHAVVGTTGLDESALAEIRARAERGPANAVIAPNFAIGALLMMRFAAEASRFMHRAEIIELHHDGKLDAPSGTALRTAGLMEGSVPIHSVRLPGLVAHQEVILGGVGETLTIRHDSIARESFMPGVLVAVRAVADRPGLTLGLESILFE